MTITVGKYTFEGPLTSPNSLENRSGVYAIHCLKEAKYALVDVGESATVRDRVVAHDRKDCWDRNCPGNLTYSAYYTPNLQQPGRMQIEQEIRQQYNPPCGAT